MVSNPTKSLRLNHQPTIGVAQPCGSLHLSGKPHTWQAELDKQKALLQEKLRQRQMAEVPRFGKIEG